MEHSDALTPINKSSFGKSNRTLQYLTTLCVCLAAAGSGTIIAWSSPALSELSPPKIHNTSDGNILDLLKNNTNISTKIVLTKKEEALLGSFANLGALFYAIPSGFIADKFGRKIAFYSSGIAFILGWCLIVFASNVSTLLIGRIFGGMALGGTFVVAPIYIGEIADNSIRAELSSYFPFSISAGILATFVIGSVVNYISMSIIVAIFPLLLLVSLPFLPESHVHFMKIGKTKEAEQSLIRFRGNKSSYDIRGEMKVIQEEIDKSKGKSGGFSHIISNVANRRAMVAVLGTMGLHQLCGINAVTFYVEQIFAAAGTNINPSVGAIIMVCFQCAGGYLSTRVIERAGRKYFLILSSVGMMMGLCGLGMFFHLQTFNLGSSFGFLPIACVVMFIVAFTLGYGNIPFMLVHELLSPEIRGVGSGMAIVIAWTVSFLVTYIFPISINTLGDYITFYILGAMNAFAVIFTSYFVPETRGKTLMEIQEILAK